MYNKLFTKILDSSIWLAPDPHRLVWITLIAAMDEEGNAMFASAGNLAARARVTRKQAEAAIASFEGPDPDSGDPENEGRRIERFPGGWHVLNAAKYRALVSKAIIQEQTRARVARHRAKIASNAAVTQEKRTDNAAVTPSLALSVALSERERERAPEVSPGAQACAAIKDGGIVDVNPSHPGLLALLDAGVTAEELRATAAELVGKGKGRFAMLLSVVKGRRADAAAAPVAAAVAAPKHVKPEVEAQAVRAQFAGLSLAEIEARAAGAMRRIT